MSQEIIVPSQEATTEVAESRHSHLRRTTAVAVGGALLAAGGVFAYSRMNNDDPCATTMEPGDTGTHVVHLPGGSMIFSEAEFDSGMVKVSAGGLAVSEFVHTIPADKVKDHPSLRYDATPKVQVTFHVTEDAVTTSCVARVQKG